MPAVVRVGDTINVRVGQGHKGFVTAEVTAVTNQNQVDCVYYNPDRVEVDDAVRATDLPVETDEFVKNI